ncbi:uncharacterized protein LOC111391628 [Olea europaea var. sylvestris]|uniref:uncharacterized protein LOC111391628 n=1 Tax=Olea europaea var. sylvestris TaxID=158386 RepID=UPI000C1CCF7A|nr:uncharacterized protein LOC111391628 [Olea europaea var. sylvestris]
MRKGTAKRSTTAELLASPPAPTSNTVAARSPTLSPPESPVKQFEFNLNGFTTSTTKLTSPKKKSCKKSGASAPDSKMKQPTGILQPSLKSVSTISDLKDLASSKLESIKCQLDSSHSEIMKDLEASQHRLQKRLKLQKQACQQVMDEAEKEYKKMSERINEGRDAMKASYVEFLEAAQASACRLLKTSIPELSQSFEKSIDTLKSRYGISSTAD